MDDKEIDDAEKFGPPNDEEQQLAETALEAIEASDRLGVIPFWDTEDEQRVLFLCALQDKEDGSVAMHPLGPLTDFDDIEGRYEVSEEFMRQ
jgi:hypothetical protein